MVKPEENARLHQLLRGERAAVESYERALADLGGAPPHGVLHRFLEEHRQAVAALQDHIAGGGDEPGPGPWGAFVRAVEAAAAWVDDATTLKALKEGEVHGADEYRTALGLASAPPELAGVIRHELLPRQVRHIEELDELIQGLERPENRKGLRDRIESRKR